MPQFLESHRIQPFTADQFKQLQTAPKDEFGITHHDILFNERENKIYCLLDAPDKAAVNSHHEEVGVNCEWIHPVQSARA